MTKDLRITIIQSQMYWENSPKNLHKFSIHLKKIKKGETDLVVLPEMFSTGFSMNPADNAETMDGTAMQWMFESANKLNAAVCGSLMIKDKNKFYNRFIWMNPDGTFHTYDKRHLFRMSGEDSIYTVGKESILIEYKGWSVCPQICYDLRFPVWSRNRMTRDGKTISFDYDVLIYVANWPSVRRFAWKHLLIARAIENQCYVVGVNRIGRDGNGFQHNGDSIVLDQLGTTISKTSPNQQSVETVTLSMKNLNEYRKKFPVFFDADEFNIK